MALCVSCFLHLLNFFSVSFFVQFNSKRLKYSSEFIRKHIKLFHCVFTFLFLLCQVCSFFCNIFHFWFVFSFFNNIYIYEVVPQKQGELIFSLNQSICYNNNSKQKCQMKTKQNAKKTTFFYPHDDARLLPPLLLNVCFFGWFFS